ncbi:MAG: amidase family protein [Acidimicrobiia bacterium]
MDDELLLAPAHRLAAAVRGKEVSSRELLDGYLDRIGRLNPAINSVVTLDEERAAAAAEAADAALAAGDDVGPLHGLPITIKDAIETAGIRSTGGATELTDHVPAVDAPAVARLKAAGAIVFGKTNVPRWSGDFQTFNAIFGQTNNPWDVTRTTGGSSGGAAAAVAAGFTSFEVGTDIGGSVRIPSHCCGVFGLKPSFGVIPQRGYLDHVGGGLTDADINVFGPIARSARDLDLLLGVLAGPEPERAVAWRLDLPAANLESLSGLRVGTWLDDPACPVDTEYGALLRAAADRLVDAGARVDDAHPPVTFGEQHALFTRMIMPAISPSLPDEAAEVMGGSHRAWLRAEEERARLRAVWAQWFTQYDVLLLPVMTVPAFPHDNEIGLQERRIVVNGQERSLSDTIQWLGLVGVVGLPSAVVPIGKVAGLPVGMQIVAPFLHDRRAVRGRNSIDEVLGAYAPPPLELREPSMTCRPQDPGRRDHPHDGSGRRLHRRAARGVHRARGPARARCGRSTHRH